MQSIVPHRLYGESSLCSICTSTFAANEYLSRACLSRVRRRRAREPGTWQRPLALTVRIFILHSTCQYFILLKGTQGNISKALGSCYYDLSLDSRHLCPHVNGLLLADGVYLLRGARRVSLMPRFSDGSSLSWC